MGVAEPQHQPFPTEHQLVHVAAGNGGVKGVLTPASLPLNPYPEEDRNALVSDDPFQTAEEKYRYPTILQPQSSTWHSFSLHAPLPLPPPPSPYCTPEAPDTDTSEGRGSLPPSLGAAKENPSPSSKAVAWGTFWIILFKTHGCFGCVGALQSCRT